MVAVRAGKTGTIIVGKDSNFWDNGDTQYFKRHALRRLQKKSERPRWFSILFAEELTVNFNISFGVFVLHTSSSTTSSQQQRYRDIFSQCGRLKVTVHPYQRHLFLTYASSSKFLPPYSLLTAVTVEDLLSPAPAAGCWYALTFQRFRLFTRSSYLPRISYYVHVHRYTCTAV